ncbi:TonB-dependent receptor [Marinifilum fragile]|uniref:SusC/RagA family TonB-linked outer membrane protein n=1 Tax=Marinifilum fragile TaxID=570161 RepID=UPI002AA8A54D|nr:TonB-dependent receptor [Marinifilum fragile]
MKKIIGLFVCLFIVGVQFLKAQDRSVSGTVTLAEDGLGVPGASVIVKGTSIGTTTNLDGKYVLTVPTAGDILIFSFVGMKTQEIKVGTQQNINVELQADNVGLDEVVAIGYGTMRKSDLTGATSRVSAESIVDIQTPNVSQALQGKLSGVSVQSNSGAPGGDIKIRIRGTNSINGSNAPLVIVDGFIGQSLSDLNPNDIESLEVLKDASATAIYGSRGANGVILVTTKGGKDGKMQVSYNGYVGVQQLANKMDLLDAASYAEVINQKRVQTGGAEEFSAEQIENFKRNGGTDWQDEVYRTALTHNHDLSVSGKKNGFNFLFSGQYLNQEGILKNSNYERFSYRANVDVDLSENLKMGVRINGILSKDRPHKLSWPNGSISNDAVTMEPTLPIYDKEGNYTRSSLATISNPVADYMEQNHYIDNVKQNINAYFDYQINDKWNVRVSGGYSTRDYVSNMYSSVNLYAGEGDNGRANINNRKEFIWQNTNILTYKNQVGKHKINFTFVNEQTGSKTQSSALAVKNFDVENGFYDVSLGKEPLSPSSSFVDWQLMSFLGRLNYVFNDKYLVTLAMRADGSSKFADNHKWGYFPSGSFAWRLSEESFMKDIECVDNLKLRSSFGVTGSQATAPYQSKGLMSTGVNYPIDGSGVSVGIAPARSNNPFLSWEKTAQVDFGFDVALFNGKLSLTADYYYKKTKDLLLEVAVPFYTGFKSEFKNLGEVENKGIEFDLGTNHSFGELKWSSNVTVSINRNKVMNLGDAEKIIMGENNALALIQKGKSLGLIYGYKFDGVWQQDQADQAAVYGNKPGDARFVDVNDDKAITADDRTIIGYGYPKWNMGWSNSFTYKNFDMDILFTGTFGNDIKNEVYSRSMGWGNQDPTNVDILSRWTPENPSNSIPAFSTTYKTSYLDNSSATVEDGSYIRLSNISLGYTFSKSVLKRYNIEKMRVFVSGQNLWTSTDYRGYDPEVNNPGGANNADYLVGFDRAPYPLAKVFNFGVNLTF